MTKPLGEQEAVLRGNEEISGCAEKAEDEVVGKSWFRQWHIDGLRGLFAKE